MSKVLIIEDDDVIARGMARHLQGAGFDAITVANGETGIQRLRFERPDVCVLDLMLPGLDGWRVIEQARNEGIGTPSPSASNCTVPPQANSSVPGVSSSGVSSSGFPNPIVSKSTVGGCRWRS